MVDLDSTVKLADGVGVFVREVGDGFPVIVLHGGPGLDHTSFRPYLDPLGDEFRLLYVDERGQGRSERVEVRPKRAVVETRPAVEHDYREAVADLTHEEADPIAKIHCRVEIHHWFPHGS